MGANDWDLDAIVKGCSFAVPRSITEPEEPLSNSHASTKVEQMDGQPAVTCFPDLMMTPTGIHELEELLKPFFPVFQQELPLLSPQESSRFAAPAVIPRVHQIPQPKQHQQSLSQTLRSKGRKDQQKRVLCQVPVDGLSPDTWAWRKYGQKPIKGSPYPRGYYRCSSSKGCLARKQVEQSQTDPGMLVVTYTAEHNHSVPRQRHSLAGITRHKFQPAPSATSDQTQVTSHSGQQSLHSGNPTSSPLLSSTAGGLSPTLTASMEDEIEHEENMLVEDEVVFEDQLLDIQELERHKLARGCSCCHSH